MLAVTGDHAFTTLLPPLPSQSGITLADGSWFFQGLQLIDSLPPLEVQLLNLNFSMSEGPSSVGGDELKKACSQLLDDLTSYHDILYKCGKSEQVRKSVEEAVGICDKVNHLESALHKATSVEIELKDKVKDLTREAEDLDLLIGTENKSLSQARLESDTVRQELAGLRSDFDDAKAELQQAQVRLGETTTNVAEQQSMLRELRADIGNETQVRADLESQRREISSEAQRQAKQGMVLQLRSYAANTRAKNVSKLDLDVRLRESAVWTTERRLLRDQDQLDRDQQNVELMTREARQGALANARLLNTLHLTSKHLEVTALAQNDALEAIRTEECETSQHLAGIRSVIPKLQLLVGVPAIGVSSDRDVIGKIGQLMQSIKNARDGSAGREAKWRKQSEKQDQDIQSMMSALSTLRRRSGDDSDTIRSLRQENQTLQEQQSGLKEAKSSLARERSSAGKELEEAKASLRQANQWVEKLEWDLQVLKTARTL